MTKERYPIPAAQYKAAHYRVGQVRGRPRKCEHCKRTDQPSYDWANLTGDYFNPDDYIRLCRKCHNKHDGIGAKTRNKRRGRSLTKKFDKTCCVCGTPFKTAVVAKRYCSHGCFNKFQRDSHVRVSIPDRRCLHCDTLFSPTKSNNVFCSIPCGDRGRRKQV